jgi:hypothetical protein
MPITDDYKYTAQLFAKARQDPDPVSGFMNGDSWETTQEAMFIVKGAKNIRRVQDMLIGLGLSSSNPVNPKGGA